MDNRELAAFRMTLSDYIAEAKRLDLDADHIRALENASMRVRLTRAQEIYLKTAQHVEKLAKRQGLKLDGLMREVYTDATYRTAYETQKLKGFENFREVPARQIDAAVSRPWAPDGADFSARIWKQKKDLINNLQTDITRALMTGETTTDLAEQISKRFNTTYGQAYRLVETETAYIQERAMLDTYDALDIEKYEICAVLDSKTSETCQHLDGKIFDKKDAKPGVTMPPFHCHCRTTTIPYIEGVTDDGERVARDPETGKTVEIPDMTYKEWKATYVVSEDTKTQKSTRESGALTNENDPTFERRIAHAERYYEFIRKVGKNSFVDKVSYHSGFSKAFIGRVFDHVFINKHQLSDGYRRFDPSYDMAQSFQRLLSGTHDDNDIVLLRHEHLEKALEKRYNLTYEEAHKLAERKYFYDRGR